MIKEMINVMAPMRDGTKLACNVYRPDDDKAYPAILLRTPYLKERIDTESVYAKYRKIAASGYNMVFQDVRGTGRSEGTLDPTGADEIDDGYDTVEWIASQSWCDGNVGMQGLSYFGFTQMAAAQNNPPHLKTLCPFQNSAVHPFSFSKSMTFGNYHLMWVYGRVLDNLDNWYDDEDKKQAIKDKIDYYMKNWNEVSFELPLIDTPAARIEDVPQLKAYLELVDGIEHFSAFMKRTNRPVKIENIKSPMFFLTGWFDAARDGTIDNWERAKMGNLPALHRKLVIGPWLHGGGLVSDIDGRDFGKDNSGEGMGIHTIIKKWFDYWLKDEQNGILDDAPVMIFVLGDNCWRAEQEWPPARAVETKYYIHSGPDKNSGILNAEMPGQEDMQTFVYDPENPMPSRIIDDAGRTIFADPTVLEERGDVLVYTSPALEEDLEITGIVRCNLFASTDAKDTDFFCRICDVDETGYAFPLAGGIVRGRFRQGTTAELLEPGKVYSFSIELGNISNVFKKGHKIKVHISSSFYPEHDRNLNTPDPIGRGAASAKATQTIYHDAEHPSHLLLPVIPKI